MVEWDQAFKHNHKQSRYKLHNPWEFLCSIMLQTNSDAFVAPILTQWLIVGIYNIYHTSQKLCYVLRAQKATLLTFNMLWVVTLLYEFSTYEVSIAGRSCFHKSLMKNTNCCWPWASVAHTEDHFFPKSTDTPRSVWFLSLYSALWLSCCSTGTETHSDPA